MRKRGSEFSEGSHASKEQSFDMNSDPFDSSRMLPLPRVTSRGKIRSSRVTGDTWNTEAEFGQVTS